MSDPHFVDDVELATAAFVRNETEAEMVRGLLESAEIPSMIEAAGLFEGTRHGFYGGLPVYGGAQKVLVHAHRLEEAKEVIAATLAEEGPDELS